MKEHNRIDWPNHLVAFLSALVGILVAFQLQAWQADRSNREKLSVALRSLQLEAQANDQTFDYDIKAFHELTAQTDALLKFQRTDSTLACSLADFEVLKKEAPAHYSDANIIRAAGQLAEVRISDPIDFIPRNFITDNWEAAKSSGTLERMSHDQLVSFIELYSTLNRNFGSTPDDYTIYIRQHADDINWKELNRISRSIEGALNVKKSLLNNLKCFEEIKDFAAP
jgi:hypothetical protein